MPKALFLKTSVSKTMGLFFLNTFFLRSSYCSLFFLTLGKKDPSCVRFEVVYTLAFLKMQKNAHFAENLSNQ